MNKDEVYANEHLQLIKKKYQTTLLNFQWHCDRFLLKQTRRLTLDSLSKFRVCLTEWKRDVERLYTKKAHRFS